MLLPSKPSTNALGYALAFVALLVIACQAHAAEPNRPNILLLLSDDHSYPLVGCYGSTNVMTPTLDRLAEEGMKFHRFFVGSPQCVPSRATLMTGRSAVAARMTRFTAPLPRDEVTFPELLRDQAGYYTGICGRSYHLDGAKRMSPVVDRTFEEHHLQTFADRVDFLNTCPDDQVAEQVATFLEKRPDGKPFFLWANFSDPHHPWTGPEELRPDPKSLVLPKEWPDVPGLREQFADYCGEVNRLDHTVASVLDVLRERGELDKTIIVFAGDNGLALPHGKGSLYDPGVNVPLIVRWPAGVKAGGDSKTLISGEDIAPTLLEAAGVAPINRVSGRSFLPLLKGEKFNPREHVFFERGPHGRTAVSANSRSSTFDLSRGVRSDRYKFIYNCTPWIPYSPVDSAQGAGWVQIKAAEAAGELSKEHRATYFTMPRPVYELYDLENDPAELVNLSGRPEVRKVERELRAALAEKMVLDWDYLPLPDLFGQQGRKRGARQ